MNTWGTGFIPIIYYGTVGEIATGQHVILTEAGDDLLTESSDTLLIEN